MSVTHGLVAPLRLGGGECQLGTKLEDREQNGVDDVHHGLCLFAQEAPVCVCVCVCVCVLSSENGR